MNLGTFRDFLMYKQDFAHINNSKLARKADISATYLGEIINKKKIAPERKTQIALANALNLEESERRILFDLAAKERMEVPVDIIEYIFSRPEVITEIRDRIDLEAGKR